MITNCGKFLSLVRDQGTILGFDLVRRASSDIKLSRDNDAVTINVVLVCFVPTVLEGDRDFGGPGVYQSVPELRSKCTLLTVCLL